LATPEENRAAALARAEAAEASGNSARAATWYASVARWDRLIAAKEAVTTARENVAAIQARVSEASSPAVPQSTAVVSSTPVSTAINTASNTNTGTTQQPTLTTPPGFGMPTPTGTTSIGQYGGVDTQFTAVPFSQLDATTRSTLQANASGMNMTAEQYYNMRGGVNKAGYYGDSWSSQKNLTDAEYAKVVADTIAAGGSGTAIGAAINAATAAKAAANGFGQTYSTTPTITPSTSPTNQTNTVPSVSSTPLTASLVTNSVVQTIPVVPVKTAPIDTILTQEETVPVQLMYDLVFENIGGQELINIARNDTVNGQNIIYQPIKNLTAIQQQFNPNNIVALQSTSDKYFQNFSIKFENKVPTKGTGPNDQHVYIDIETGSLVIELVNMDQDEQVETEITTGGTIYEVQL
jgi:hypothetical protein